MKVDEFELLELRPTLSLEGLLLLLILRTHALTLASEIFVRIVEQIGNDSENLGHLLLGDVLIASRYCNSGVPYLPLSPGATTIC